MSAGKLVDPKLLGVRGFDAQNKFAPTEAQPVRMHARMAGDPFVSQAQRGFMYSQHPEIAKRWEKETPAGKLPAHKAK